MEIIVWAGLMLLGFTLGYFFQTSILIAVTILSVIIGFIMGRKINEQGMGGLMTIALIFGSVIVNIAMWTTRYFATEQNWISSFIDQYILR